MVEKNEQHIIACDLDGTLINSDLLHESFWSAFSSNWKIPFKCMHWLIAGKTYLKKKLFENSDIDVNSLPYNKTVIDYVRNSRQKGNRTVLITASNQKLAEKIAAHLGLFDEVYGSSLQHNLKGKYKARFLCEKYGEGNFDYIGDSLADLPVWRKAKKAITNTENKFIRNKVEKQVFKFEHLKMKNFGLIEYFIALRPHQWMKNLLIFLPMISAHQFDYDILMFSIFTFICFCLFASTTYIINDLLDLKADRDHPRKKDRLIASGKIPINNVVLVGLFLFVLGLATALMVGLSLLILLLLYFVVTTFYSVTLKQKPIVDICVLAGLYSIRIIAGGVATGVGVSFWLLAFSIFIFLSLAAVKRLAELVDLKKRGQQSIQRRGYKIEDLPIVTFISISSGFNSVLVMALYVNSPKVVALYNSPSILWGICCVLLYWLMRVIFITHRGEMSDDPVVFAVKDKRSVICLLMILFFVIAGTTFSI